MRARIGVAVAFCALFALIAAMVACSRPAQPAASPSTSTGYFPPVQDLWAQHCALPACHGDRQASGLDLRPENSWASTVNVASVQMPDRKRVVPGEPQNSYLLSKVKGEQGTKGGQMPLGRTPLATDQERLIEDWIAAGAPK